SCVTLSCQSFVTRRSDQYWYSRTAVRGFTRTSMPRDSDVQADLPSLTVRSGRRMASLSRRVPRSCRYSSRHRVSRGSYGTQSRVSAGVRETGLRSLDASGSLQPLDASGAWVEGAHHSWDVPHAWRASQRRRQLWSSQGTTNLRREH